MTKLRLSIAAAVMGALASTACDGDTDDWWMLGSESVTVHTYYGIQDPPPGSPHLPCNTVEREPNDSIVEPTRSSPGCSGVAIGELAGSDDIDYWQLDGSGCSGVPRVTASPGTRACVFPVCSAGGAELGGCDEGDPRFNDAGFIGCCSSSGGSAKPVKFDCSDPYGREGAPVFVRMDLPEPQSECVAYAFEFTE